MRESWFWFVSLLLLCLAPVADEAQFRRINYPDPVGTAPARDPEELLRMMAVSSARLAASPMEGFTCSSFATRAEKFRTSIALDFGPVPKGFQDLTSIEVDGTEVLRQAFTELFTQGVTFTAGHWSSVKRWGRHSELSRDVLYVCRCEERRDCGG